MPTGNIVITVSGGVPSATVNGPTGSGGTIADGTYQVNVDQDGRGTTVSVDTPYGAAQNSDIRSIEAIDG